jgi:transposase
MSKAPEPIVLKRLPPDIRAAFEVEIAARLEAESVASSFKEANARLEHLIKELHHALYGKKSEKLAPDDRQLCFEDLEVAVTETEEQQARLKDDAPHKKAKKPKRNLGNLPEDLPCIENIIEPDSILCPCGCGEIVQIGEDRTERLDITGTACRSS